MGRGWAWGWGNSINHGGTAWWRPPSYIWCHSYAMEKLSFTWNKTRQSYIPAKQPLMTFQWGRSHRILYGDEIESLLRKQSGKKRAGVGAISQGERAGEREVRVSRSDDMCRQRGMQLAESHIHCYWLCHWSRRPGRLSTNALSCNCECETNGNCLDYLQHRIHSG